MRSKEYWEGRFIDLQRSQLKRADSFAHELEDLHARMQKEIDDDITVWHKKVATANGISMADAKKLMSRKDRKEFQWTLEEYEQHAKADLLSGVTSAHVMNASANWHLSYLDGMKLQLEHHVDKLYKNIDSKTRNHFKESLNENYLNTAFELQKGIGIGEKMEVPYDERKLENILRTPWASDGKNFSQRIWKDRTQLVNNLQKNLSESVIRGDSDTDMIQALSKDEKRAEFNTRRLVETESAFFDSESERQCCEDFGIEKYRFLAVLDMKTSDICQELDNKVFLEKERQVGVNAPPMHPFCRSTTAPVIDEDFLTSRRAKNPKTGEYDEIPPDMNYKEWKAKYVDGKENVEEVKQEQVKTESSKGTGASGAEIKIESPRVESKYSETPIPSREEKFDSKAYEDRVQKRAKKQAVQPVTIETERPVNYGNTEKIYGETEISKEVQEKRIVLKKKANNFIENLENKIDSKEITKELADETQNLIKELEKQTDDIVKEFAKTTSTIQEGKNSSGVLENLASSALLNSENENEEKQEIVYNRKKKENQEEGKPISKKLFNQFVKKIEKLGAEIRNDENSEEYLKFRGVNAITLYSLDGDIVYFKRKPTISEVLEELHHLEQKVNKLNADIKDELEKYYLNEIEAQEYLLKKTKKYKIPPEEVEQTKNALLGYQKDLEEYYKNKYYGY